MEQVADGDERRLSYFPLHLTGFKMPKESSCLRKMTWTCRDSSSKNIQKLCPTDSISPAAVSRDIGRIGTCLTTENLLASINWLVGSSTKTFAALTWWLRRRSLCFL